MDFLETVELHSGTHTASAGAENPSLPDTLRHFENTREPFAILVAGVKYYVITSPLDASEFYNNVNTLSWDGFLNETLTGFGVSADRLEVLWEKPAKPSEINPNRKCLIHLTQDLYKQHLLPGPTFSTLVGAFERALNGLMTWEKICSQYRFPVENQTINVSLFEFSASFMIDATQMTLFDNVLFSIDPTMTSKMRKFTDDLWKLMYPSRLIDGKEVSAIRAQFTDAFKIYQRLPRELRKGESWVVSTLIEQYQLLNIHEDDSAAMLVMVYWTGDANAYKLAFWIMAYILFDEQLYERIRSETLPAVKNGNLDLKFLANECPQLRAVYHEALRLRKRDLAFRKVDKDTEIGGRILRSGNFAMVPVCQLHDNRTIFGDNSLEFDPERFLRQPDLTSSHGYKPYGGGKTYCPGRFFAMQEIFGFVALQIHRFKVRLTSPQQGFPEPDESMLTLGVSRPMPGSDLRIQLSVEKGPLI
ncbi:hypothetical protein MMC27_001878 [Xylographa pallens]|nr:hypothetical protein [Xylographa pallens]